MYIFAYGTLKRGYGLSDDLMNSPGKFRYAGEYTTGSTFGLFDLGYYPLLCPQAPTEHCHYVKGEVWEVDEQIASQIANIESGAGYYPMKIWVEKEEDEFEERNSIVWAHPAPKGNDWMSPDEKNGRFITWGKKS